MMRDYDFQGMNGFTPRHAATYLRIIVRVYFYHYRPRYSNAVIQQTAISFLSPWSVVIKYLPQALEGKGIDKCIPRRIEYGHWWRFIILGERCIGIGRRDAFVGDDSGFYAMNFGFSIFLLLSK